MGKINDVLLAIFVLFNILSSCTEYKEEYVANELGDKIAVSISVVISDIPEASSVTRTMGEKPALNTLHLAVFDASGYLLEYVKATPETATENNTAYKYSVSLTPTDFKTTIHFIGNGPEKVSFGTEVEVIGAMFTTDGEEAYWQRIQLDNGIEKDGDGLAESVKTALNGIQMIRNFAWIQLDVDAANFNLDSYCVLNTHSKGSVAPYNTQTKAFETFGDNVTLEVLASKYDSFIPEGTELNKNIPDENDWIQAGSGFFMYERELPRTLPAVILMKGTYDPDSPIEGDEMSGRYYKVNLRDNDGNYFPILRNFKYRIMVQTVTHEGHASAQVALDGAGSGDVSTSIETESFSNISNGVVRLFVSYTDTTLVSSEDVTLKYKFVKYDENGDEVSLNDNVVIKEESYSEGGNVFSKTPEKGDSDDLEKWRTITVEPTALGNVPKIQSLLLVGTSDSYSLQRRVRFTLRPKMTLIMECDPNAIRRNVGEPFDLHLKIPGGLGSSLFPLEFELEAEKQSITPNQGDDLPVVTGNSIVPGKESKTTIGFIKSLSWEEYNTAENDGGFKSVYCHFKSSKAESATKIYAKNEYFNLANTDLGNYTPKDFSNLEFSESTVPFGRGQKIDFSFDVELPLPEQGVKVTLDGLEPATEETRLTYLGVVDGKAQYNFSQELQEKDNVLQLVTLYDDQSLAVKLEAFQYNEASASLDFKYETFSNLRFNPTNISGAAGTSVTFSFNMSKLTDNVIVTLNGLMPASTESRLVLMSGNRYSFTPSATSSTLQLVTTEGIIGEVPKVTLEALGFKTASAEASVVFSIPAGNINVGDNENIRNNTTFTLYTTNPGGSYWPSGEIASFRTKRKGSNSDALKISKEQYDAIVNNGGYVYIRFYNWSYYVATVKLEDLLKGEVTLSFTKQS